MTYKSRFAPSPSGLLHIGNIRSALINWGHSISRGGEFLLRIDDTDLERSKPEFYEAIKEDLAWLGLSWSKIFNQSDRKDLYDKHIDSLKSSKRLYPCFESIEELSLKKKSQLTAGNPPIYDRSALNLSDKEINNYINQGKKPHWRFKLNDSKIEWKDIIKGNLSFETKNISDPILIREDGSLLYHLPSVIDDIEEKITDIIRGEDHISNTAFHIQIFHALGHNPPNFGHHTFITDEEGKSFAKRLGSLSIKRLREVGYENITIINYLLSIGTSKNLSKFKDIKSILNNFNIKNLATSSPKFSIKILELLNKEILQSYEFSEIKDKFKKHQHINASKEFWRFAKNNINFFSEVDSWWSVVNSDKIYSLESKDFLFEAGNLMPNEPYDENTWEEWIDKLEEKTQRKGKDLFMPLRLALTGKDKGPELKYLIPLLGKKKILRKLGH